MDIGDRIIEILEGYIQNETRIDRNEYYETFEQLAAYATGKNDGMTVLARMILKELTVVKP
jgi:hypothetical protein